MNDLLIVKTGSSLVRLAGGSDMYSGSQYAVRCEAPEFARDAVATCALVLETDSGAFVSCRLLPDPLRRGVRVGEEPLSLDGVPGGRYWLCARLDGSVLFRTEVVVLAAPAAEPAEPAEPGRWAEVTGTPVNGSVSVANMQQVVLDSDDFDGPLNLVVGEGPFEAYVVVRPQNATLAFPFTDVTVNAEAPVWDHKDSMALASREWSVHVVKVAGTFRAELHAGFPAGAEADPDDNLVVSTEVNS